MARASREVARIAAPVGTLDSPTRNFRAAPRRFFRARFANFVDWQPSCSGNWHPEVSVRKLIAAGTLLFVVALLLASAPTTHSAAATSRPSSASPPILASPMRIAEGPPGQVLVSDSRNNAIVGVDEDTQAPIWSVDIPGSPMAIGYASRLVLVGNAATHNVEAYRMKGSPTAPSLDFQFNLGGAAAGSQGSVQVPSDLSVDPTARLAFVLDGGARRVKVFNLQGGAVSEFPRQDSPA